MLRAQGDLLAFRHELARQAILDTIAPPRRRALHALALRALASSPAASSNLARLADHAEGAADGSAVLAHAPAAAARAAALGAHREAAEEYARALRFAASVPPADRARLLDAYADECTLVDRLDEAIRARRWTCTARRAIASRRGPGWPPSRRRWFGPDATPKRRTRASERSRSCAPCPQGGRWGARTGSRQISAC
jgi:hypothetical protein